MTPSLDAPCSICGALASAFGKTSMVAGDLASSSFSAKHNITGTTSQCRPLILHGLWIAGMHRTGEQCLLGRLLCTIGVNRNASSLTSGGLFKDYPGYEKQSDIRP